MACFRVEILAFNMQQRTVPHQNVHKSIALYKIEALIESGEIYVDGDRRGARMVVVGEGGGGAAIPNDFFFLLISVVRQVR